MENSIDRPIDVHCKGLIPGADPYISQLVQMAELEREKQKQAARQEYVVLQARVSANHGYSFVGSELPEFKEPRFRRSRRIH